MTGTPMTFGANGGSLNTPGSHSDGRPGGSVHAYWTASIRRPRAAAPWFRQSSFVQPTGVRFGTFRPEHRSPDPASSTWTLPIFKIFNFTERYQDGDPRRDLSASPTLRSSTTRNTAVNNSQLRLHHRRTGGGRGMQLGAKMSF